MRRGIIVRVALIATVLVTSTVAVPASAASTKEFRLRDDCDPATFNAVLGAGACIGNGDTTIDEFNAELAQRHSVGSRKFNPDHTDLKSDEHILLVNRGGETHIFVPAGQTLAGPAFGPGTTRYQCCIHPWMRSLVTPH